MRWFRSNRKAGGRLALFALALQLVLSFGHIHAEDIYGYGAKGLVPSTAPTAVAGLEKSRPLPADHSSKHSDDYCAICATMSLLGNSFVAAAPQLAVPLISHAVEQTNGVVAIFIAPRRAAFQSRAPPIA